MQHDELMQELSRMKWENKKLNELLSIICRNYTHKDHDSGDQELFASKKRRFEEIENHAHGCCGECSPNRPREIKSNISRVHVRIDPSDTTLVCFHSTIWFSDEKKKVLLKKGIDFIYFCWIFFSFFWKCIKGSEGWISMEKIWTEGD